MKCKYFWGNDNRCINNKKCGSKNSTNCNAYKPKDSKCIGCPYGKDNLLLFSLYERFVRRIKKEGYNRMTKNQGGTERWRIKLK